MTLEELAAIVGTDHAHLSRVERGLSGVSLEMLERYLYACGYELALVRANDPEGAQVAVADLTDEDRATVRDLVAVLPRLPEALREEFQERVRAWHARYAGDVLG